MRTRFRRSDQEIRCLLMRLGRIEKKIEHDEFWEEALRTYKEAYNCETFGDQIRELRADGLSVRKIAKKLGLIWTEVEDYVLCHIQADPRFCVREIKPLVLPITPEAGREYHVKRRSCEPVYNASAGGIKDIRARCDQVMPGGAGRTLFVFRPLRPPCGGHLCLSNVDLALEYDVRPA